MRRVSTMRRTPAHMVSAPPGDPLPVWWCSLCWRLIAASPTPSWRASPSSRGRWPATSCARRGKRIARPRSPFAVAPHAARSQLAPAPPVRACPRGGAGTTVRAGRERCRSSSRTRAVGCRRTTRRARGVRNSPKTVASGSPPAIREPGTIALGRGECDEEVTRQGTRRKRRLGQPRGCPPARSQTVRQGAAAPTRGRGEAGPLR